MVVISQPHSTQEDDMRFSKTTPTVRSKAQAADDTNTGGNRRRRSRRRRRTRRRRRNTDT